MTKRLLKHPPCGYFNSLIDRYALSVFDFFDHDSRARDSDDHGGGNDEDDRVIAG